VSGRAAVFLDRDGTIIEDSGFIADPRKVRLLPGAAAAIRKLNERGFRVLVVTNQSGIARGLLSLDDYRATERRLDELLSTENAAVDGHYFCPHLPELSGPCECRKPGTLLYRQAAERFGVDLSRSWWVGDRLRDVTPAETFAGRGILVGGTEPQGAEGDRFLRARDLMGAVELIDPGLSAGGASEAAPG
jgi:D-glycero-D-manno-heptose 1,7-bisphosphate phosphatase